MQPILAGRARHRNIAEQQERCTTADGANDLANSVKHWMHLLRLDGRREPPVDHKVYQHTCHRNIQPDRKGPVSKLFVFHPVIPKTVVDRNDGQDGDRDSQRDVGA